MIFPYRTLENTRYPVSLSISMSALIVVDHYTNLLVMIMDIPNIQITLATMFVVITVNSKHLRGTTYRQSKNLVDYRIALISKTIFLLFLYSILPAIVVHSLAGRLMLMAYLPYYLDFAEYRGDRRIVMPTFFHRVLYLLFRVVGSYRVINCGLAPLHSKDGPYILGLHPHGLFPFGTIGCFTMPHDMGTIQQTMPILLSQRLKCGIASFALYLPIIREIFLWLGAVDCSRPVIKQRLRDGDSVAVFVGGAQESEYSGRGSTTLIIDKRNGIFRLALETGAKIVPVYTFGNNNIYRSYSWDFCGIFNGFKVVTGIWFPRGYFELRRHQFISVIGNPVEIGDIIKYEDQDKHDNQDITDDMVARLKIRYIESLTELFDRYKYLDADIKDKSLVIV